MLLYPHRLTTRAFDGAFDETELAALIVRASTSACTGRLELRQGDGRRAFWLRDGRLVALSSTVEGEPDIDPATLDDGGRVATVVGRCLVGGAALAWLDPGVTPPHQTAAGAPLFPPVWEAIGARWSARSRGALARGYLGPQARLSDSAEACLRQLPHASEALAAAAAPPTSESQLAIWGACILCGLVATSTAAVEWQAGGES